MFEASLTVPVPAQELLETPAVLREPIQAHRALAELKGIAKTTPNEGILISTLSLQEAQSSSKIENIMALLRFVELNLSRQVEHRLIVRNR